MQAIPRTKPKKVNLRITYSYVTDHNTNIIRKVIIASGVVSTLAGQVGLPNFNHSTVLSALRHYDQWDKSLYS